MMPHGNCNTLPEFFIKYIVAGVFSSGAVDFL
jgi:hypothetical protein